MKMNKLLAATATVVAFTLATPALAAPAVTESGDGSSTVTGSLNDYLDLLSNNAIGNGENRDNVNGSNQYSGNVLHSTVGSNIDSTLGSNVITAKLYQEATINNREEVVSTDGEDRSGYNSGANHLGGSAFAAFAGINNLTQNTGVNNINQTGVNIAAQGTVNLGGGTPQ